MPKTAGEQEADADVESKPVGPPAVLAKQSQHVAGLNTATATSDVEAEPNSIGDTYGALALGAIKFLISDGDSRVEPWYPPTKLSIAFLCD
ncbi:hypothetical protein HDU82_000517 [Entophlyctis luteolus]|nr:hypothetical protein HDU82_000517 [Entophlyctis luteolus]